jgi:hypothetical protein
MLKEKENDHQNSKLHNAQIFEHVNERHPILLQKQFLLICNSKTANRRNWRGRKIVLTHYWQVTQFHIA